MVWAMMVDFPEPPLPTKAMRGLVMVVLGGLRVVGSVWVVMGVMVVL